MRIESFSGWLDGEFKISMIQQAHHSKMFIIQIKLKKKRAAWLDYNSFDREQRARTVLASYIETPDPFFERREIRLIYREVTEAIITTHSN